MQQRIRNAEIQKQKEEWQINKQNEEERQRHRNKEAREKLKRTISLQRNNSLRKNLNKSALIKLQRDESRKAINIKKQKAIQKVNKKKEFDKYQHILSQHLKLEDQKKKKKLMASETQKNLLLEEKTKQLIEAEIARMENEEYELIKRIKNTELQQQSGKFSRN